jgi:two-component system sensor histidine kinase CiaH
MMRDTSRPEVRRLSIRVAINATLLVAAAYLLVAAGVMAYVSGSLTAQVDSRLTDTLAHVRQGELPHQGEHVSRPGEGPLGPQRAFWAIGPNGTVISDQPTLVLPIQYRAVTAPTTINISGSEIRVAGEDAGSTHLVVGESLNPVNDARATIVFGELLIAPVLLLLVFFGAIAIGRRVATPIERARQRQLDFTADASHELRTPLSVIEANASLALAQDRDGEWYRHAFENVDSESRRMRGLLEDLLWLARFDATQRPANAEPVDLGVLAEQTADRFGPIAERKRLSLAVRTDPDGAIVSAPPEWLDRLLGVLLDNACKYSPEGGAVTVDVAADATRVVLTVDDSGPGIAEGERMRIFDRFHRAADGPSGAGLGLAIGDAIVRATGGRWAVGESAAGGARMSIAWPRASGGGGRVTATRRGRVQAAQTDRATTPH